MDAKSILMGLGLTHGESAAYMAMLEMGGSTAGRVAKKSGVSQSKIYDVLERLCSMGLASKSSRHGRMFFSPSEPRALGRLVANREQELDGQREALRSAMPSLLLMGKPKAMNDATVYEGYDAIKNYFYKTLENRCGDRLVFGARSGYPVSKTAQWFFRNYHRQRARKGGKLKIILNEDVRGSGMAGDYERMKLTRVRYMPQVSLSSIGIEGDSVDMLIWTHGTAVLFVVRSREVARTFRDHFWALWGVAKPAKK